MMADEGPRHLPPQPTTVQVSIPQPVVPEVTLLWEGEESVYWKPHTPGRKTASSQSHQPELHGQPHTNILPQRNTDSVTVSQQATTAVTASTGNFTFKGYSAAFVNQPTGNGPSVRGVSRTIRSVHQPMAGVHPPSNECEFLPNFRPPGTNLHQHPKMFHHSSVAPMSEISSNFRVPHTSGASQASDAISQQNQLLPQNGFHSTVSSIPASHEPMYGRHEREYGSGQEYLGAYSSSNLHKHDLESSSENDAFPAIIEQTNNNSSVAKGVLLNNKAAASNFQLVVSDENSDSVDFASVAVGVRHGREFSHGASTKPHCDNFKNAVSSEADVSSQVRYGLASEELKRRQHHSDSAHIPSSSASQQHRGYNPLSYSSEKKPLQERHANWYRNGDRTPVAAKDTKAIIPRIVDFESASPADWRNKLANKENLSPDHPPYSTPDYVRHERLHNSDKQITPYQGLSSQSPIIVNTPDPFLQKIIEGKDQQIFHLHKVLETILSKNESKDRTGSQSSSFSASPRAVVHREVSTQTTGHLHSCVASRDVGTNTEFSWPEVLKSFNDNQNNKAEGFVRSVDGPSTILKNSTVKSTVMQQRSSNTSSVRFDTESDRVIEARCASTTREQIQNEAVCYNERRAALQAPRLESESRNTGSTQPWRNAQNNVARNVDEGAGHDVDEPEKYPHDRGSQRSKNGGVLGGNNHREVSLTLREVVLTTIEEDPCSPQASLHLNLSDYPGDTILPQTGRIEPTSARRSGARAAPDSLSPDRRDGRLVPARPHRDAEPMTRYPDGCHRRPGTPVASRRRPAELGGQGDGTNTGVTIYRNVMNNIDQLLERDRYRDAEEERSNNHRTARTGGHQDAQLASLEQQLQQFGLSFLEPRALHSRNTQSNSSPTPASGVAPSFSRRTQASGPPPPEEAPNARTSAPREFSVATEEFLRNNGLLEP